MQIHTGYRLERADQSRGMAGGVGGLRQFHIGALQPHRAHRPPFLCVARDRPNPHRPFRRCRFPDGEVRHTHRARQPQPRD